MARTGLAADIVQADIRSWAPAAPVDAVLLDAPCSATGIFRRHPDVLHRIEQRQIDEMAVLQTELLARAARWVKPGGTLIYATCSLERAEGEDQVATFLAHHPSWRVDPVRADELPDAIAPDAERFCPHLARCSERSWRPRRLLRCTAAGASGIEPTAARTRARQNTAFAVSSFIIAARTIGIGGPP